ncbi:unannotated protein [freshwater metagenome]|uniref:Unannotated protein n=1 Tax=freshwater metagenome TaxID=449393 RepID=A0A6J7R7G9_9ZZZZ
MANLSPMTPPRKAAGQAEVRRRRPREQTREMLLLEAEAILLAGLEQGDDVVNPLAGIRVTDVLASLNAKREAGEAPMTTGAAYQIWPSQTEFQDELLERIMHGVALPWLDEVRAAARAAMDQGVAMRDVLISLGQGDADPRVQAELSLALGLTALVAPERVRAAEEEANAQYLREFGAVLAEIIEYGGRKLAPGVAMSDVVWAVEAHAAGMNLRGRSHPEVVARTDRQGQRLSSWALASMVEGFTVEQRSRK